MKKKISVVCLLSAITIISFVFPAASFAQIKDLPELKSSISAERPAFGAEEPLNVRFTLTNTSGNALNVLKWQTPLEGFTADIFEVKRNGEAVRYIGRLVKRGAPQADDYVTIAPGESVSTVVDLSQAYAIYDSSEYSVRFRSQIYDYGQQRPSDLVAKNLFVPKAISSDVVTIKITEQRKRPPEPEAPPVAKMPPIFKNCSQTQQTTLNNALSEAEGMAMGGYVCAASVSSSVPRYKEWFGTYTAGNKTIVNDHFNKIYDALAKKTITFNCSCNENYYAYVYPNNPYEIYVCKTFWSAPVTGTDSKAGTIIHETSHFYVVASTKDHVYGQTNCRSLANTDPSKAIMNADSHEYFAENTPFLKCGLGLTEYSLVFVIMLAFVGAAARRDRIVKR